MTCSLHYEIFLGSCYWAINFVNVRSNGKLYGTTLPHGNRNVGFWMRKSFFATNYKSFIAITKRSIEDAAAFLHPPLLNYDWIKLNKVHMWRRGAVAITTDQLHSTNFELRFCAGSNPACSVSEIRDDEHFWQWSKTSFVGQLYHFIIQMEVILLK